MGLCLPIRTKAILSASLPRIRSDASTWCQTLAYASAVCELNQSMPDCEQRETHVADTLGHGFEDANDDTTSVFGVGRKFPTNQLLSNDRVRSCSTFNSRFMCAGFWFISRSRTPSTDTISLRFIFFTRNIHVEQQSGFGW